MGLGMAGLGIGHPGSSAVRRKAIWPKRPPAREKLLTLWWMGPGGLSGEAQPRRLDLPEAMRFPRRLRTDRSMVRSKVASQIDDSLM